MFNLLTFATVTDWSLPSSNAGASFAQTKLILALTQYLGHVHSV